MSLGPWPGDAFAIQPRSSSLATAAIASSANPSRPGAPVTLTVNVTTSSGSVEFYDGSVLLGTVPIDASGRAALTVPFGAGAHTITAAFATT